MANTSFISRLGQAVGITPAVPKTVSDAFATLDGLKYSKQWDTSGVSIVLREEWRDQFDRVVRAREHDYAADVAHGSQA